MSSLHFVITGCSGPELKTFKERTHLDALMFEPENNELVCTVPSDQLDLVFHTLEAEAEKGWKQPDSDEVLAFDCAFFPYDEHSLQPVRQLRGQVAARLARKRKSLPPACALPGQIFGGEEK